MQYYYYINDVMLLVGLHTHNFIHREMWQKLQNHVKNKENNFKNYPLYF